MHSELVYKVYKSEVRSEIIRQAWDLLTKPLWPEDEIRPFDEFEARQLDVNEEYRQILFCAFNANSGELCGMIVLQHMIVRNFVFGEYLMMKPEVSGVGEGRKFYNYMRSVLKTMDIAHLFLEYDDPDDLDSEGIKRLKWYYRLKVYRVFWEYWQPPYMENLLPKKMALAYDYGLSGLIPEMDFVRYAVKKIYSDVYGIKESDPLFARQQLMMEVDCKDWLLRGREAYPW